MGLVRTLSLLTSIPVATIACLPGAVGEWRANVTVVEETGAVPDTIASTYRVDSAVVSSPFAGAGDCGVRVEVVELGVFELDGGAGCTDTTFDVLLQGPAILESVEPTLAVVRVNADEATTSLVLEGDDVAWTRRFEGPSER